MAAASRTAACYLETRVAVVFFQARSGVSRASPTLIAGDIDKPVWPPSAPYRQNRTWPRRRAGDGGRHYHHELRLMDFAPATTMADHRYFYLRLALMSSHFPGCAAMAITRRNDGSFDSPLSREAAAKLRLLAGWGRGRDSPS